jgi:hypothetical protein
VASHHAIFDLSAMASPNKNAGMKPAVAVFSASAEA